MSTTTEEVKGDPAMKTLQKLKAWIVYGGSPGWYSASLILENGWVPFGHCCSHPYYMPGDLITERKKRQDIFAEMGYAIELQEEDGKYITYAGSDKVPEDLHKKWESKIGHKEMEEAFRAAEKRLFPEMKDEDSEIGMPKITAEVTA